MGKFNKVAMKASYEQLSETVREIEEAFGEVSIPYVTLKLLEEVWLGYIVDDLTGNKASLIGEALNTINKRANKLISIASDPELDEKEKLFRMMAVRFPEMDSNSRKGVFIQKIMQNYLNSPENEKKMLDDGPMSVAQGLQELLNEVFEKYVPREFDAADSEETDE